MTESELWAYIKQLDEVVPWCEDTRLRKHYVEERERVDKLWRVCFRERVAKSVDIIKSMRECPLFNERVKSFLEEK